MYLYFFINDVLTCLFSSLKKKRRLVEKRKPYTNEEIYKIFVSGMPKPPGLSTFRKYISQGKKFGCLAAAGGLVVSLLSL